MAKYIVQAIVLETQVIRKAFARVLQQKYAVSKMAPCRDDTQNSRASANVNMKFDLTLQDKYCHKCLAADVKYIINQRCFFSQTAFSDVFSEHSKEKFLKRLRNTKSVPLYQQTASREAAVLVPLCLVDKKPSVLLTVRSALVYRNKGDVSFPGGMKDIPDKDAIHVALRETKEEIGISASMSKIWTAMDPLPSRTGGITVTPVIAFLGNLNLTDCQVNKQEVDSVFTRTLESLCNPNNWRYTQFKVGYTFPVYLGGEYRIWGLTAVILHIILQALVPDSYKNNVMIYKKVKNVTNKKL